MKHFSIEQALFGHSLDFSGGGEAVTKIDVLGRSPGFGDDWTPHAEEIIRGYGERPAGVRCPLAVFAQPFGNNQVAVVQVADQSDDALAFHFLVVPKSEYENFLGDPFHLVQKLPADWRQRGSLPAHSWPCAPPPVRTVAEVRRVLQRLKADALSEDFNPNEQKRAEPERTVENSESPALLGATQVLVDGGRVIFQRPRPDLNLLSGLWTLLPTTTRCRLWPASFAFGNQLRFDAVVLPRPEASDLEEYTSEDQAIDYPEGRYELSLQTAAETGDQRQLDHLFSRRSVWDTWRLGLQLLALMIALVLISSILPKFLPPAKAPTDARTPVKAQAVVSMIGVGANDPWLALAILHAGKQDIHDLGDTR